MTLTSETSPVLPRHTSLAELPTGERATLAMDTSPMSTSPAFVPGRALLNRLAALGFTPGVEVTMIQNVGRGPLIVRVRGSQVALGRGEAKKILVQCHRR